MNPLALLLAIPLGSPGHPAQGPPNLLVNGDLEMKYQAPWEHPLYGADVVKLQVHFKGGVNDSTCLLLEGLQPRGQREWHQDVKAGFPLEAPVTLAAMVRTEEPAGQGWIDLRAMQSTRILDGASSQGQSLPAPAEGWKRLTASLRVPAGTTHLRVALVVEGRCRLFADDFVLVAGESPGVQGATPDPGQAPPAPAARIGGEEKAGVYSVRIELEVRPQGEEKNGHLFCAIPARREGQLPFFFKINSLPADAIRGLKLERRGGPEPDLLDLELFPMKGADRATLEMEARFLVLPPPGARPLPETLDPAQIKWPAEARAFLSPSALTRTVEEEGSAALAAAEGTEAFPQWLAGVTAASSRAGNPALVLTSALRGRGFPARLLTGTAPAETPADPTLAVELFLPQTGWLRILPGPLVVGPAAWEFMTFREISRNGELRASRLFPALPEQGFLETKGRLLVKGIRDPEKGRFLSCSEAIPLAPPPAELRERLVKALTRNWERWLAARARGKGDLDAEMAGQAAAQTNDYSEMLRLLRAD